MGIFSCLPFRRKKKPPAYQLVGSHPPPVYLDDMKPLPKKKKVKRKRKVKATRYPFNFRCPVAPIDFYDTPQQKTRHSTVYYGAVQPPVAPVAKDHRHFWGILAANGVPKDTQVMVAHFHVTDRQTLFQPQVYTFGDMLHLDLLHIHQGCSPRGIGYQVVSP